MKHKKTPIAYFYAVIFFIISASVIAIFLPVSSISSVTQDKSQNDFLTAEERKWVQENNGKIRLAPDPYFPPLEYFNEKGELEGIAPDYIKLMEKKIGLRFKIVRLKSFEEILAKAKKGEIDLVCTVVKTPERSEYLLFTSPYISIPNAIVVRNDMGKRLEIDDLRNLTDIVYQGGYAIGNYLAEKHGLRHPKPVTSAEEGLKNLSMGRIDAMVGNLATISYYAKKMNLSNLKMAGDCGFDDTLSFASRKDLPILNSILEKTLAEISGREKEAIRDNWIKIDSGKFYNDKNFWITTLSVFGIFSVIITILSTWNRILKRLIAEKTLELRKSEEKYRSLVENSTEAIFVVQEGLMVFANPASIYLTGFRAEEIMTKKYIDLIHDEDKEMVDSWIKKGSGENSPLQGFMIRLKVKGEAMRWVETKSVSIDWEDKPAILIFLSDITEKKWAEEERVKLEGHLVQAQKMEAIGRLAGGVAHDFNNMLTAIIGHTEIAMLKVDSSESLYKDLEEISNAAERSASLTRQLLSFARKQTAVPKVVNLNDTIEPILRILARLIGENIELSWRPSEKLDNTLIDPGQIDQILTNLLVNARDAIAGDSGKISIETTNIVLDEYYCSSYPDLIPGEYVMLSVSDNGCGMDNHTKANIFEPFFTTKESGKGTGLGLATVYGIVKQNCGFINVYTEPGAGTSFKIYFKKHSKNDNERPADDISIHDMKGTETILIVEDEKVILEIGRSILERFGYTVLPTSNPLEAIKIAENHEGIIHLLITDVVMPEMNGLDLSKNLSKIKPEMKILFMSGYTADIIARNGILKDGMDIIPKPFTAKDLALKVREVLDRAL